MVVQDEHVWSSADTRWKGVVRSAEEVTGSSQCAHRNRTTRLQSNASVHQLLSVVSYFDLLTTHTGYFFVLRRNGFLSIPQRCSLIKHFLFPPFCLYSVCQLSVRIAHTTPSPLWLLCMEVFSPSDYFPHTERYQGCLPKSNHVMFVCLSSISTKRKKAVKNRIP